MEEKKKKNIIITGASSGIGKKAAIAVAPYVDNMFLIGRDRSRLSDLSSALSAKYPEKYFLTFAVDLSIREEENREMKNMLMYFRESCNSSIFPNMMIYSAADFQEYSAAEKVTSHTRERIYQVNLHSFMSLASHVIREAKKVGYGQIISIGSQVAYNGSPFKSAYAGSKAALNIEIASINGELEKDRFADTVKLYSLTPGPIAGTRLDCVINAKSKFFGITQEEARDTYAGRIIDPSIVVEKIKNIITGNYTGPLIEGPEKALVSE